MHCLHHSLSTLPSFAKSADKTAKKSTFASCKTLQIRAMRAVVQRVTSASVEVDGHMVSEIGPGLLVLVGLHESDTDSNADYICRKVLNMRLFTNESTGRGWDQNVMQRNYEVLLGIRFTHHHLVGPREKKQKNKYNNNLQFRIKGMVFLVML
ncbi:hypothetical protein NC652_027600 [Populus alba x Populus x berolinensis]|nr:hypothetical protein NC652_027600 [Populus alba x Populus x berolinensis]